MNIDDLRVAITVLAFIAFLGIVVWTYSRKRKRDFEQAAHLPFSGEEFGAQDSDPKDKEDKP